MIETIGNIVREAGEIARSYFRKPELHNVEFKGEVDLVTVVDGKIEDYLRENLAKEFPDIAFFGEEGDYGKLSELGDVFIVDPLDGTSNFVHGHPFYSISLGLRQSGEATVGVVYLPEFDDLYSAENGKGAKVNGKPIQVSKTDKLLHALATTGFACVRQRIKPDNLPLFTEIVYKTRGIRRCGSAAIDLCYVAEGRYDLFWEYNLSPWDVAAGALICQEAGGVVTNLTGGPEFQECRQIAASNGLLHDAFLEISRKYFQGVSDQ